MSPSTSSSLSTSYGRLRGRRHRGALLGVLASLAVASILPTATSARAGVPIGPGGVATGLALWLDASDPDADGDPSDDPADGTTLTVWQDRSGNDRDATVRAGQSPGTFRSAPSASIAGRQVVSFSRSSNSAGSIYEVAGLDLRASVRPDVTVLAVYRPSALSTGAFEGNAVWGIDNGDWDRFFISFLNVAVVGLDAVDDGLVGLGPTDQGARVEDAGAVGVTRLLTVTYDGDVVGGVNSGPVGGSAVYFTGELVRTFTDTSHATDARDRFMLGWDGDDNPFVGDIAEVIIYDRVLTASELRAVNGYLATKYSLTLGGGVEVELSLDDPGSVRARRPVAVTLSAGVLPVTEGCPLEFELDPSVGEPRTATTGADGRGSVTFPDVPPGTYEVTVSTAYPCEADPDSGTLRVEGDAVDRDRDDDAPVPASIPSGRVPSPGPTAGIGLLAAIGAALLLARRSRSRAVPGR